MNVKTIRRENLRELAQQVGGVTALARYLGKSQSQISHLIGANPIKNVGDRLAAYIEECFQKPEGWLDQDHHRSLESELDNMRYPLIEWHDSCHWLQNRSHIKPMKQIISEATASDNAFAIEVQDDSMHSRGIGFPRGAKLLVEPNAQTQENDFVLVHMPHEQSPLLRQVVQENGKRVFKSLNANYPSVESNGQETIIGKAIQLIVDL